MLGRDSKVAWHSLVKLATRRRIDVSADLGRVVETHKRHKRARASRSGHAGRIAFDSEMSGVKGCRLDLPTFEALDE